ncbi:MAG: TIGR01458 family HAD-type hydrolase [Solirubrobacterales bacterium]
MPPLPDPVAGALLDIDGVLHVGPQPLPGAREALERLRGLPRGVRLVTNTTSKSRAAVVSGLREQGFELAEREVLTPAALALAHCREQGYERVELLVGDSLREDLAGLREAAPGEAVDAVVLGDVGEDFRPAVLDLAFRQLLGGAALVALQHNRFWRREDGLAMDVGAYAAALEYAAGVEAVVVGKPSPRFFAAALADLGVAAGEAVMVGDDVEGDVGGGLGAGIASVLVRTGKYDEGAVARAAIEPTATVDSIAGVPALLGLD